MSEPTKRPAQGCFAHFTDEDVDYFQSRVDEMWEKWWLPGVIPVMKDGEPQA